MTNTILSSSNKVPAIGPLTYYAEFRVTPSFKENFDNAIKIFAKIMLQRGVLTFTLKQMIGESTMVKNYPESYKGLLKDVYVEAEQAGTLPLYYSLFLRFSSASILAEAKPDDIFDTEVLPYLHGAIMQDGKLVKTPEPMSVYRGVFETIAAGNQHGIYKNHSDIMDFLLKPVDAISGNSFITVENHVFISDSAIYSFEQKIVPLLTVAQETFQPETAVDGIGQAGSADNRFYRKALSTEILRKTTPDGQLRAYIMHGIWESVWDHENSHLDPRFKLAAGPVGAMVEIGPVEPFYTTQLTVLKA
ncbi:TPA: hypothetical protein N2R15_005098 [Citrobacter amalonaticus]|nr:hypothetical protein [Citrobacter amalonaticus]